jgi:hypothetical protein
MGCSDPWDDLAGEVERARTRKTYWDLLKKAQNIPLSRLTLGDIQDFIGIVRPAYQYHEFDERDLEILKNIVRKGKGG